MMVALQDPYPSKALQEQHNLDVCQDQTLDACRQPQWPA